MALKSGRNTLTDEQLDEEERLPDMGCRDSGLQKVSKFRTLFKQLKYCRVSWFESICK